MLSSGCLFLAQHECQLNFQRNTLTLQGQELTCTDRQGRVLLSKLQACQQTEVPPGQEATIVARATIRPFALLGVTEGWQNDLLLASTLNRPDTTSRVLLRCFNCSDQTFKVAAGSVVGE